MGVATRVKARCNTISLGGYIDHEGNSIVTPTVILSPVMAQPGDEDHENTKFWKSTPSGAFSLTITNPLGAEVFEINREYYVDFTPVD